MMSLPRFFAWSSCPFRKPSPAATISTIDTIPQAIPNMVRNVRSLCAHNVRSTSPMRSRRTISQSLDASGQQTIAAATGRTLALDTRSSASLLQELRAGLPGEEALRERVILARHCYSQWMVGTCPPGMKTNQLDEAEL